MNRKRSLVESVWEASLPASGVESDPRHGQTGPVATPPSHGSATARRSAAMPKTPRRSTPPKTQPGRRLSFPAGSTRHPEPIPLRWSGLLLMVSGNSTLWEATLSATEIAQSAECRRQQRQSSRLRQSVPPTATGGPTHRPLDAKRPSARLSRATRAARRPNSVRSPPPHGQAGRPLRCLCRRTVQRPWSTPNDLDGMYHPPRRASPAATHGTLLTTYHLPPTAYHLPFYRLEQLVNLVGFFPGELRFVSAEVSSGGRLPVDGPAEVQVFDNPAWC